MPQSHSAPNGYDRLIELAQSQRYDRTQFIDPNDFFTPSPPDASRLRRVQKFEKEQLQLFMDSGLPNELTLWQDTQDTLRVMGQEIRDWTVMFLLDNRRITIHNKRSKHLIPLLTKLGEREGLELDLVDDYPNLPDGGAKVAFWKFNNPKEVDDKQLLDRMVTRLPQGIPERVYQEAYVGPDLVQMPQYGSAVWSGGVTTQLDEMPF